MKYLFLIVCLFVSFSVFSAAPKYSDYIGTAWGLEEIVDDEFEYTSTTYKFTFFDTYISIFFKNCYRNKEESEILECKEFTSIAENIKINAPESTSGIHANQYYFTGSSNGEITFGAFIANENCLLLPDTEAPEDCLRKF